MEIFQHGVTPPGIQVADERRAVYRREHCVLAADHDIARRIAGLLLKHRRRRIPDDFSAHAGRETHPLAVYVGPGLLEQFDGRRIAEINSRFRKDGVGVSLDEVEALFAEQFVFGNGAGDAGHHRQRGVVVAACLAGASPAALSSGFRHDAWLRGASR